MKLPQETQDNIDEYFALVGNAETAMSLFWGERKAIRYRTMAQKKLNQIKDSICSLYPDVKSWKVVRKNGEWKIEAK